MILAEALLQRSAEQLQTPSPPVPSRCTAQQHQPLKGHCPQVSGCSRTLQLVLGSTHRPAAQARCWVEHVIES